MPVSVYDSQGVPGPGIWEGNYQMLGNFAQCQRYKATYEPILPGQIHDFDNKYCRLYTVLNQWYTVCK